MQAPLLFLALAAAEILLPPWPLSADGEAVGTRGGAALVAQGGRVEPLAPGLFRVTPDAGAAAVRLAADGASAVAPVEPPPAAIAIALGGPAPVKGRDRAVALEIVLPAGAAGAPGGPLEIVASSGRVRDLAPVAPGRFRAVYEPSPTRHPEVAVLLALAPRCPLCAAPLAVGYAIVPLAAAIDLPGTSEPGVRTTVTVAGRSFGPAIAGARGRFSLPIVVPPGARFASAESVDALGNRRRREIDLRLPEVDRLACAGWPRALPADGRSSASIWCVASTAEGTPARGAALALSASAGAVEAAAPFEGALQRARFVAPAGASVREAVIFAAYPEGGGASRHELRIALAPLAPAEIVATLEQEPVPLGATVRAETAVLDVNGVVLGTPSGPPGAAVGFVRGDAFVAREAPGDYVQASPLAFALAPGEEVATLTLRRAGADWVAEARTVDARPAAGVALRFGSGAVATTDARGEARAPASGPRETVSAANGARAAGWEGVAPPPRPFEIARVVRVSLRPPTPVDVLARVEGALLRWRVEREGRPLGARAVTLSGEGVVLGPAEPDGEGGRAAILGGAGTVAVVDDATGVAAIVEVP